MLDGIEALIGLESVGTVSEAAVRLRLTQSAVSKRIRALEVELGYSLVEADGRKLRLTPEAIALLSKAKPLLAELKNLKRLHESPSKREFSIGISDSIASSWGPRLLKRALTGAKGVELEIHVHRSLLILERLRLGHYELGLVTGHPNGTDLVWTQLVEEPMVLVGGHEQRGTEKQRILTIENASATWREIGDKAMVHSKLKEHGWTFLESFAAAAQMAKEGFGRALVPLGTAASLGFRGTEMTPLSPRLSRQIHFVSRKSIHGLQSVSDLRSALLLAASKVF